MNELDSIRTSYLICSTSRSGSNFLCSLLDGIAGNPREHITYNEKELWEEWKVYNDYDFISKIIRLGTVNGIFGSKILQYNWDGFRDRILAIPELNAILRRQNNLEFPEKFLPNLHYVWLSRRDKVKQAISFWRALQTDKWVKKHDDIENDNLEFDFKEIKVLKESIERRERAWQEYFERLGVSPFRVIYEDDLERNYETTIRRMLKFLEIEISRDLELQTEFRKQSDELSEKFYEMYMKRVTDA